MRSKDADEVPSRPMTSTVGSFTSGMGESRAWLQQRHNYFEGIFMTRRNFGWIPSPPDQRDFIYSPPPMGVLPDKVDLRKRLDPAGKPLLGNPWQQGMLAACSVHSSGKAWQYTLGVEGLHQVNPSRLFVYYNGRAYEGWEDRDSGAYLRDVVKGLSEFGAPPEKFWPYHKSKFDIKPPKEAYTRAEKRIALNYLSVPQDSEGLAIASSLTEGFPVIIGFTMYGGSELRKSNGWYQPLPKPSSHIQGYHAVLVVGYTTIRGKRAWIILDSAGSKFGDGGYWYMAHDYLCKPELSTDFWTLRKVGHVSN